jgi:hypothetical protein
MVRFTRRFMGRATVRDVVETHRRLVAFRTVIFEVDEV